MQYGYKSKKQKWEYKQILYVINVTLEAVKQNGVKKGEIKMYNDYYLQQIDNKLNTTNSKLIDIIDNQEAIIEQQQQLISGDIDIIARQEQLITSNYALIIVAMLFIIYNFIVRSLK